VVELESEIQNYGGWNMISCIQVDDRNAAAELQNVQQAIGTT
jgi:hypothetical protein